MAETKISARDIILLVDIDGDATFKPVACLTSNSITSTLDTIDATSKCGDSYTPSPSFSQTIECEGFAIDETGTPAKDSYQQLYAAHTARTIFAAKFGKAVPTSGDITHSGTVWISDWGVTADDKDDVKFTATFVVAAPPLVQTETT